MRSQTSNTIRKILLLGAAMVLLSGCKKKPDYVEVAPDIADSFPIAAEKVEKNYQLIDSDGPKAILHTTAGDITIQLYPEQAPKAVENFITLAQDGYYDGTLFHYAKRDELTQTGHPGDPEAEENSIWGEPFEDELDNGLYNFKGAVGMAGDGGETPDSNESQFYLLVQSQIPSDERIVPANCYMKELIRIRFDELQVLSKEEGWDEAAAQKFEDELNAEIQAISEGLPKEYEHKYDAIRDRYHEVGGAWGIDYKYTVFGQIVEGLNVAEAITQVKVEASNRKPVKDVVIESIEIVE